MTASRALLDPPSWVEYSMCPARGALESRPSLSDSVS